ncbi:Gx transporter family protein [uncultured Treponema sp.]|uniref:Gx transporter family protein n=1 Tax=uncultured Treponema sp. TaxID=162155 RepID=UPI0025CFFD40|nr:Gx transporter family protein [uncultured Treponema sp.]
MPRARLISFLAALCLFLSAIENAIPKPLPFLRLGLANLPILLALFLLNRREVFSLVLFKVLAQGVISGTLFSYIFLFSAGGSFSSAIAMMGIYEVFGKRDARKLTTKRKLYCASAVGISLFGSLASTCTQLLLAKFFLFGSNTKYVAPILLISGLLTGLLLGIFAELFIQKSKWFNECLKMVADFSTDMEKTDEI